MKLIDQVRDVVRKKHYSIRTEQAYVQFHRKGAENAKKKINRYAIFLDPKCPQGTFLIVSRPSCPVECGAYSSGVNGK